MLWVNLIVCQAVNQKFDFPIRFSRFESGSSAAEIQPVAIAAISVKGACRLPTAFLPLYVNSCKYKCIEEGADSLQQNDSNRWNFVPQEICWSTENMRKSNACIERLIPAEENVLIITLFRLVTGSINSVGLHISTKEHIWRSPLESIGFTLAHHNYCHYCLWSSQDPLDGVLCLLSCGFSFTHIFYTDHFQSLDHYECHKNLWQ